MNKIKKRLKLKTKHNTSSGTMEWCYSIVGRKLLFWRWMRFFRLIQRGCMRNKMATVIVINAINFPTALNARFHSIFFGSTCVCVCTVFGRAGMISLLSIDRWYQTHYQLVDLRDSCFSVDFFFHFVDLVFLLSLLLSYFKFECNKADASSAQWTCAIWMRALVSFEKWHTSVVLIPKAFKRNIKDGWNWIRRKR